MPARKLAVYKAQRISPLNWKKEAEDRMRRDKAEGTKVTYDVMWQTFLQCAEVSGCAAPFTQEKTIRAWEVAPAAGYSFGAIQNMRSAIVWKRQTRKGALGNGLGEKTARDSMTAVRRGASRETVMATGGWKSGIVAQYMDEPARDGAVWTASP
jgi:hypothetical protein